MEIKYFKGIKNLQELKNLYRQLAKKHHPDFGGDTKTMQQINGEFEYLFKVLPKTKQEDAAKQTAADYMQVIKNIIHLPNIEIEIIGTWVWATGDTKPVKEELKKAGFKYAGKKVAWYWHGQKFYRKTSKKILSMDEIRDYYGTEKINRKKASQLAGAF